MIWRRPTPVPAWRRALTVAAELGVLVLILGFVVLLAAAQPYVP